MVLDTKWLDFIKAPLRVQLGIALSCGVLLVLHWQGCLDLSIFGDVAKPIVLIIFVLTTSLSIFGIGDVLLVPIRNSLRQKELSTRRIVKSKEKEEKTIEAERKAIARLDHLSRDEIYYVSEALVKGSQTIYTYYHAPAMGSLQGKGLIWLSRQQHNKDYFPFTFHDFVWAELLRRKDEFLEKEKEHIRAEKDAKK